MSTKKFIPFLISFIVALLPFAAFPQTAQALDPDVTIAIDDGDTTAIPGTSQTYAIEVVNNGPNDETDIGIFCTLPPDQIMNNFDSSADNWAVSISGGGSTASGAHSSGKVMAAYGPDGEPEESLLTIVDLPSGASATVTLTLDIRTGATGDLSIEASLGDGNPSAADTDTLTPHADLSVTINDSKSSLVPGTHTVYTITVTNAGPSKVVAASLSCLLPSGVDGAVWGANSYHENGIAHPISGTGSLMSAVDLDAGGSYNFWLNATTSPGAIDSLSVTAAIIPPPGVTDPRTSDNNATDTDTLTPQANLGVWVSFGDQTGNAANEVTFDVEVSNRGDSNTAGVTLSVPMPSGVTLVSAVPDTGTYNSSTSIWTVGYLGSASSPLTSPDCYQSMKVKAAVDLSAAPQVVTVSVLSSDVPDPDTGNNSDSLTLNTMADLALTASIDHPSPDVGDSVVITVTLTNNGPDEATDIWVNATLPPGLTYGSDNPSTGYYNYDYSGFDDYGGWEIDSLSSGSSATLGLQAIVSTSGTKTLNLDAEANEPDRNRTNNSFLMTIVPRSSTPSGPSGGGSSAVAPVPAGSKAFEIPAAFLLNPEHGDTMILKSNNGNITIPSNLLTGIAGAAGKKTVITIGQGDKSALSDEEKAAVGDRPLIQLSLLLNGKQTDWSNPDAPVTVSIPYTPTAAERANPESIVIWYIDGGGNATCIPNGHYDPGTGTVIFATTHFSVFAVGRSQADFHDVAAGAWYREAVNFIAAREITTGTGGGNFRPDAKLTRGQFLVMLMKSYEIAPDGSGSSGAAATTADNFTDAGNTYYTGYLAAAKRLGISDGVGNNLFAPEKEITRQEMFTLLYNALDVIGSLPQDNTGKPLTSFRDEDQIASWAKDAIIKLAEAGTIGGSNGMLLPESTATRAEMAQVLCNLLSK